VERRFQRIADVRGVTIVDDYAHHPTEIMATIAAAREAFPGRRLVVAFQPHLYTRTRDFATEFGRALSGADAIFLTELYPAREQPIAGVDSGLVERAIASAGGALRWRGERSQLARALSSEVHSGDVVITVGAGDITRSARELRDILTDSTPTK
jgi:UDP-N-acetylmuramate--alanine ligase